jgi:hypothetical protein
MIRVCSSASVMAWLLSTQLLWADPMGGVATFTDLPCGITGIGSCPGGSLWESYCSESHTRLWKRTCSGCCRGCGPGHRLCLSACTRTCGRGSEVPSNALLSLEPVVEPSRPEPARPTRPEPQSLPESAIPRNPVPPPAAGQRLLEGRSRTRHADRGESPVRRALFDPAIHQQAQSAAFRPVPNADAGQGTMRLKQRLRQSWAP